MFHCQPEQRNLRLFNLALAASAFKNITININIVLRLVKLVCVNEAMFNENFELCSAPDCRRKRCFRNDGKCVSFSWIGFFFLPCAEPDA